MQPKGFIEGKDGVGSLGGSLTSGTFTHIVLGSGGKGINYNFAERLVKTGGCGGGCGDFGGWTCDDWKRWDWNCDHNWSGWSYSGCGDQDWRYHC